MKSSYVLILLIIGIIVLHALDDRKDLKAEKKAKNAAMAKPSPSNVVNDRFSNSRYNYFRNADIGSFN